MSRRSPDRWFLRPLFLVLVFALVALPALAKHWSVKRAEVAITTGNIDPEIDLAPLVETLKSSHDVEERRELVNAIGDLAEADSQSPNLVKSYLLKHATPVLLEVVEKGGNNFLQGDAVHALRGMRPPKAILEKAAALAEADPDPYVQSRGEILRNFIASMPDEDPAAAVREVDPERAREGIAYLDKRGIAVSTESLRDAAKRADADAVRALLDAGVAPDTGVSSIEQTPLYFAVSDACLIQGGDTDWLVETVRLLVDAGADLTLRDDNDNDYLLLAAARCGERIPALLVDAGIPTDRRNGSGLSALGLALILQKFDAAEALVDKGARLTKDDRAMLEASITDPRGRELVQRASRR